MTRELSILRYGLIIVPSFITSYVLEYVDDGMFTLHFLLLLLLVSLGLKLPGIYSALTGSMELLFTAWLCHEYGSLMLFPAVSALLFYSQLGPRYIPNLLTSIHLILINVAFMGATPLLLAYINITFLLAAILTAQLNRAARGREETLLLYDELRKRHFELDETRNRLLQYAAQVENAAQSEERVRISRQLHDDIGHRLIRVKMMMEAAIHTLPSSPDTGMALMGQIRDQVSASMDDMRSAVKRINYAPQLEGAYALDRLLEETGRDTGIVTSYTAEGVPFQLYPSIQVVLYKNAREAITNGLRHGGATEIRIKVRYSELEITMEVSNNGVLPHGEELSKLQRSGGMGLKGMTERTRLINGVLDLRLEPYFTVITRLPVVKQSEIR
ncbi:sensor histidine kinase [Paenibacillus wynnii]|uniref:sensor histidine kinase n=1 Tax=Paenibacillus wynnii TaxID=268407 RepID=UPI00068BC8AB|nr:histidine kinase [Paenibacillus wynnii]